MFLMTRFLSWIFMFIFGWLVGMFTSLVVGISTYLLRLIGELDTIARLACYLIGGSAFISFIFAPICYGAPFCVHITESISKSRRGIRYIIYPIYMLITSIFYIIYKTNNGYFPINCVIMCIYYIAIILIGRNISLGRDNNQEE